MNCECSGSPGGWGRTLRARTVPFPRGGEEELLPHHFLRSARGVRDLRATAAQGGPGGSQRIPILVRSPSPDPGTHRSASDCSGLPGMTAPRGMLG